MAAEPTRKLEDNSDEFNNAQLGKLEEVWRTKHGASNEKVLDAAFEIHLITDKTRDAISEAMKDNKEQIIHPSLFGKALDEEQRLAEKKILAEGLGIDKVDKAAVFKRAFESVYGRFLLEQGDESLEADGSPLMEHFKRVLKFPVEAKFGFKGRSELKAAVRRLSEVVKGGARDAEIKAGIAKLIKEADDKSNASKAALGPILANYNAQQAAILKMPQANFTTAEQKLANFQKLKTRIAAKGDIETCLLEAMETYSNKASFPTFKEIADDIGVSIDKMVKNPGVDDDVKVLCEAHIAEYGTLKTEAEFENFVDKKVEPFLDKLEKKVIAAEQRDNSEMAAAPDEAVIVAEKTTAADALAVARAVTPAGALEYKRAKKEADKNAEALADAKKVTPLSFILDSAFPKTKSGAEVKGLERLHEEAVTKQKKVKGTYDYFKDHHNLETFLEAHNSYQRIVEGSADKLGNGSNFYTDRVEANRRFKVTEKALNDMYEPPIERDLAAVAKRYKDSGKKDENGKIIPFNEGEERGKLVAAYETKKTDYTTNIIIYEADKDAYENVFEQVTKLQPVVKILVTNLEAARTLGIDFGGSFDDKTVKALVEEAKTFEQPKTRSFNPVKFLEFSQKLQNYFGDHHNVEHLQQAFDAELAKSEKESKDAKKVFDKANAEVESGKNLTDAQAARKIIGALVFQQFPEMTAEQRAKLSTLILAGDVAKLQTEKSYAEMAREGSAEVLDTVKQVGLRARLIGFRYKDGDKVVHPFDGLKPESFKNWPSIKNLFDIKTLNYKNGAFLLAALEIFDEEGNANKDDKDKVVSIQTAGVEKRLKALLAEQLGVKDRMDEAGVRKIVDEAFKAQMEKVRPLVRTHFENFGNYSEGHKEAMAHKVEALNMEHKELQYQVRVGKIDTDIFDMKVKKLLKNAEEAGVLDNVNFSQNTVMSKLWNNKYSQWTRDKGINWGKFVGSKVGMGLLGATLGTGRGMISASGKLGLRTGSVGLSVAKLPAALLMGVGSGIFRIFRGGHGGSWWKDVRADVSRVTDPMSKWKESMVKTSKGLKVVSHIKDHTKAQWAKPKLDTKKHEERERVKKKAALRAERIKLLNEKAEMKILEVTESPFIDLAEFKARVKKLNKMVGEEDADFPADTAKAGAEKKAEVEKKPEAHGDKEEKHEKHEKKDHHG